MSEKKDKPEGNNPKPTYVRIEDCRSMSGQILSKIDLMCKDIGKIRESLYGVERAGKIEGGIIPMFHEFIDNSKRAYGGARWFLERVIVPIVVGAITAWAIVALCI